MPNTPIDYGVGAAPVAPGAPAGTVLKQVRTLTLAALPACTYSGTGSGTLTGNANGAIPSATTDGVTLAVGDDVIVATEATLANQGFYTVTQTGDASHPFVLTRRSDAAHGAAIPWGAEVRITDGATGNRAVVYVDGVAGTAGVVGTNSFKLATPDLRTPFLGATDGNNKALTGLGNTATFAPTATSGVKDVSSSTFSFCAAFWNGSASVANNVVAQHNPLTYGSSTCDSAFDVSIGGVRSLRVLQSATQVQNAIVVGKGVSNAVALGSAEGFGNFFESYGTFAIGLSGAAGDPGYSGAAGHTFTLAAKLWTTGNWRFGSVNADSGYGFTVDGTALFASAVTIVNNVGLQWWDSGGTLRELLKFDGSNVLQFGHASYKTKHLGGEINAPTRPGAYPYTLLATDRLVFADGTSAGRTLNLPAAPPDGTTYTICLRGTNGVALARGGSDTISWYGGAGQTSVTLAYTNNVTWTAIYDATQAIWYVSY